MHDGPVKILLINPPFLYFPGVKGGSMNYARPPLGIASLAAYLRENLSRPTDIRLLDCVAERIYSAAQLADIVVGWQPDLIGFSVVTATREVSGETARLIRQRLPQTRIVFGGPHITALPDEPAPDVDALFIGEGEASLLEYTEQNLLGGMDRPVAGCRRLREGRAIDPCLPRPFIEPLDLVPRPAIELLPYRRYIHSYPQRYKRIATLMTSRGCPYHCSFCGNALLWKSRVRYHSPERIFAEIDELAGPLGIDLIFFEDDTFLANPALALRVMSHIREQHPRLHWVCHTRADTLKPEIVREMAASRCVEVQLGVESGSPPILAGTEKSQTIDDIRRGVGLLQQHRIKSWATFILGNEGETRATIEQTIRFALELNPTYASFIILLPFPGTAVYESYRRQGFITATNWSAFSWHGEPVFATPTLSAADLKELRARAFRKFFLRPAKLASIFVDVLRSGSLREIKRSFLFWRSLSQRIGRKK